MRKIHAPTLAAVLCAASIFALGGSAFAGSTPQVSPEEMLDSLFSNGVRIETGAIRLVDEKSGSVIVGIDGLVLREDIPVKEGDAGFQLSVSGLGAGPEIANSLLPGIPSPKVNLELSVSANEKERTLSAKKLKIGVPGFGSLVSSAMLSDVDMEGMRNAQTTEKRMALLMSGSIDGLTFKWEDDGLLDLFAESEAKRLETTQEGALKSFLKGFEEFKKNTASGKFDFSGVEDFLALKRRDFSVSVKERIPLSMAPFFFLGGGLK